MMELPVEKLTVCRSCNNHPLLAGAHCGRVYVCVDYARQRPLWRLLAVADGGRFLHQPRRFHEYAAITISSTDALFWF